MNQNTPQTPLQAGLAAVAAMDATPECLEAIARVADPATQTILDLQEKVRALTLVAENAKALAKQFLNERELATVLAALRHWQNALDHDAARDIMPDHFFDVSPLDEDEIDDLCERLNR